MDHQRIPQQNSRQDQIGRGQPGNERPKRIGTHLGGVKAAVLDEETWRRSEAQRIDAGRIKVSVVSSTFRACEVYWPLNMDNRRNLVQGICDRKSLIVPVLRVCACVQVHV